MPMGGTVTGTFGAPAYVDGQLTDVSASSTQIVGINAMQQIFLRSVPMGSWQQLPGAAVRAAVADDGTLWVINAQDQIYRWVQNSWQPVPGALKAVSVGSASQIVGSNASGQIYRFDSMNNAWSQVPAAFAAASVAVGADGTLYAVDAADNVHRFEPMMGQWIQLPGQLTQISCNGALSVVGVNRSGQVYQLNVASNTWTHISAVATPSSRISVGGNGLYIVGQDQSIKHLPHIITPAVAAVSAAAAAMGGMVGAVFGNANALLTQAGYMHAQPQPQMPQQGLPVVQQGMPIQQGVPAFAPPVVAQPVAATCKKCEGKGGLGTFGPCEPGNMHFKVTCNVCDGTRVTILQHQCPMCHGKGGIDTWGKPSDIAPKHMHFKMACPACHGKSYTLNTLHKCSHCSGHGWFDTWSKPCMPGSMHAKTQCSHCHGHAYQ